VLQRLLSPFREFGWFAGSLYCLDRALGRLSPNLHLLFYELVVQPIPQAPLLKGKLAEAFHHRQVEKGHPEIALMPARPEIKESRFAQDAVCIATFKKDRLVGHVWLAFETYEEDELRCTFVLPESGQASFDFDVYVMPEARMGLGFAAIWDGASQYLRQRGVMYSYSRVTRTNSASMRAHERLGSRSIGKLLGVKFWTLEVLLSNLSPHLHVSFNDRSRMQLKLSHPQVPEAATSADRVPAF
jgi:hypothetical protein